MTSPELDEGFIWRGRVDGVQARARYGYRVQGPYELLTSETVTVGPRSLVALGRDPRQAQGEL
jgi:hypothetical protein